MINCAGIITKREMTCIMEYALSKGYDIDVTFNDFGEAYEFAIHIVMFKRKDGTLVNWLECIEKRTFPNGQIVWACSYFGHYDYYTMLGNLINRLEKLDTENLK